MVKAPALRLVLPLGPAVLRRLPMLRTMPKSFRRRTEFESSLHAFSIENTSVGACDELAFDV